MARLLIVGVLAFLFLQLAAGQDACLDALTTLSSNTASCAATPTTICFGVCRDYYEDVFDNCSPSVSLIFVQSHWLCNPI